MAIFVLTCCVTIWVAARVCVLAGLCQRNNWSITVTRNLRHFCLLSNAPHLVTFGIRLFMGRAILIILLSIFGRS